MIKTSDHDAQVFRSVVIKQRFDGNAVTEHEEVLGIYASKGAARAAVTRMVKWDTTVRAGRVDRGHVVWEGEA